MLRKWIAATETKWFFDPLQSPDTILAYCGGIVQHPLTAGTGAGKEQRKQRISENLPEKRRIFRQDRR